MNIRAEFLLKRFVIRITIQKDVVNIRLHTGVAWGVCRRKCFSRVSLLISFLCAGIKKIAPLYDTGNKQ